MEYLIINLTAAGIIGFTLACANVRDNNWYFWIAMVSVFIMEISYRYI